MIYLLSFIVAMAVSMAAIPLLIRAAPTVGMIDIPDSRKVHETPIPRVGGIGIVIGALVPILLWAGTDHWLISYIFGCGILLVFGVWDDIKELGHYAKFAGQLAAVIPIVYYSDIYVFHLPFIGFDEIPPAIGKPFTVFALLGMINAINHSDGLDGLAGGMATLSLACIGYLAFLAEGYTVLMVVIATMGGVFGFLRFNNHPARVFMGDGGSQFLGLTLGVLAVVLTQNVNPALSPALPALFLGLPIADILAVFWLRAYGGMNWFRATRNHIHHRLLERGFDHYESVVVIYAVQIFFILCAIFLSYESDWLIASIYVGVCALIFVLLTLGEKVNWIAHTGRGQSRLSSIILAFKEHRMVKKIPSAVVEIAIPALFLVVVTFADDVPNDVAVSSLVLAVILFISMKFGTGPHTFLTQAIVYVTAAFVVYIQSGHIDIDDDLRNLVDIIYFVPLVVIIGLVVRLSSEGRFSSSPMDYLVIFIALFTGVLLQNQPSQAELGFMVVKMVIVFYGCEVIINRMTTRWNVLNLSTAASLVILAAKGLG